MELPANEKFERDGEEFEIRTEFINNKFSVKVFLNGSQVSPSYSVDIETHQDYFMQHKESLIEHLKKIAKSDIESEMYYKGEQA